MRSRPSASDSDNASATEDDGYSLHAFNPPESGEHSSDGETNAAAEPLNLDDPEVLARCKDLKIDLYTLPCYAAASSGPLPADFDRGDLPAAYHGRFLGQDKTWDWKPAFSGARFRGLLWQTVLLALAIHYGISRLVLAGAGRLLGRWAPAALASALTYFAMTVVAAEIRRESYQITSKTTARRRHRSLLRRYRWLVAHLLAPLMSVPLEAMHYVPSARWGRLLNPRVQIFTFKSWQDAMQQANARIPALDVLAETSEDQDEDWGAGPRQGPRDTWDAWRLSGDLNKYTSQHYTFKPPPNTLRLRDPDGTFNAGGPKGWGDVLVAELFTMPVSFQIGDGSTFTVDEATIETTIRVELHMLAPFLSCTLVAGERPIDVRENATFTYQNCTANVEITRHPLELRDRGALARTCEEEIQKTQRALDEGPDESLHRRLETRLGQLLEDRKILAGSDVLQAFMPQWGLMEGDRDNANGDAGDQSCTTLLFFIGDNRPFRRFNETIIPSGEVSMASCDPKFLQKSQQFIAHMRSSFLHAQGLEHLSSVTPRIVPRGALRLQPGWVNASSILNSLFDQDFGKHFDMGYWGSLPYWHGFNLTGRVNTVLVNQFTGASLFDNNRRRRLWAEQLMRFGHFDATTDAEDDIASLALGTKMVNSWVVEHLSEAADLALSEIVSAGGKGLKKDVSRGSSTVVTTHLEARDFSSIRWVRATIALVAIACIWCVRFTYNCANDARSGLPWSIETIAAKAALLARSRIRAFLASEGCPSGRVHAIRALRIARWARDDGKGHTWHLDTRCNEIIVDQSILLHESHRELGLWWQRYNPYSLPAAAHRPRIIVLAAIFIAAVAMAAPRITLGNLDGETMRRAVSVVLAGNFTLEPSSFATVLCLILPQLLAFIIIAWWNDLDHIFRARQPWAGLSSPAPAHLNLTLNYLDGHWHLWRALANRHYAIAFLCIGSFTSLLLPMITAGVFRLEPDRTLIGEAQGTRNFTWNTQAPAAMAANPPGGIPAPAIDAVLRPPGDIRWVIHDQAVLPVVPENTEEATFPLQTFWKVRTKSLRSELKCTLLRESATRSGVAEEYFGFTDQGPARDVVLPPGFFFEDGTTNLTLPTCDGIQKQQSSPRIYESSVCYRWILRSIKIEDESEPRPGWIVGVAGGAPNQRHHRPRLAEDQGQAYLCEPDAFISTGTAEVVEMYDTASATTLPGLRNYTPERKEKLDVKISWAFSHMLNHTILAGDGNETNLDIPQELIQSSKFTGDLMGYLLYRSLLLKPADGIDAVSSLYSRLFAYTLAESSWLRHDEPDPHVQIEQWQWTQVFQLHKGPLILAVLIVAVLLSGATYIQTSRKKYLFPVAPEVLENALFFLSQSTIVDMLEKIPHPETAAVETMHRHIQRWGHLYVFGRYEEGNGRREQFGVDRVQEFPPVWGEAGVSGQDGRSGRAWLQRSAHDASHESETEPEAAENGSPPTPAGQMQSDESPGPYTPFRDDGSSSKLDLMTDMAGEGSWQQTR